MPARTGAEYIAGLRESPPEIYLRGERVKEVTTFPGLRNGVNTLARLFDMQHDPALRDEMTYPSPTTGDRVGLSFITPRTGRDLEARHTMMAHWARWRTTGPRRYTGKCREGPPCRTGYHSGTRLCR